MHAEHKDPWEEICCFSKNVCWANAEMSLKNCYELLHCGPK